MAAALTGTLVEQRHHIRKEMDRLLAVYDRLDEFEHQQRLRIKAALEGMTEASLERILQPIAWTSDELAKRWNEPQNSGFYNLPSHSIPLMECGPQSTAGFYRQEPPFLDMRQPTADLTQMPMTNPNSAWQAQPTAVPQFAPMLDNTAAYHAMPGPAAYRYPAPPTQAQQQPMWGHQDLAGPSSTIYRYPTPLTLAQQGQLASASIAELYNINSGNFFHCLSSLYHDLGSSYRDVGTRLHGTTPRHHYGGPDVHGTSPLLNAQPEPLFPHAPSYALKMLKLRHAVRETRHFTALILQEAMDEWHKLERELRIYGRQTQTDIPKSLTGDIEQLRICDDLAQSLDEADHAKERYRPSTNTALVYQKRASYADVEFEFLKRQLSALWLFALSAFGEEDWSCYYSIVDYLGSLIDSYLISFDLDAAPLIRQLFGIPEGAAAPVTTGFEKTDNDPDPRQAPCPLLFAVPDEVLIDVFRSIPSLSIHPAHVEALKKVCVSWRQFIDRNATDLPVAIREAEPLIESTDLQPEEPLTNSAKACFLRALANDDVEEVRRWLWDLQFSIPVRSYAKCKSQTMRALFYRRRIFASILDE
ncbi:hypothetical protein AAVH_19866 [Aphelenchoides avenae]|nr:hypothetical protein AAVH_19866 [Aphelenchus avenae]